MTTGAMPLAFFCTAGSGDSVVAFGGNGNTYEEITSETWVYKAKYWSKLGGASVIPKRGECWMTSLPDGQVVMHGGTATDDTWILGKDRVWREVVTTSRPRHRGMYAIATLEGKAVLFGGTNGGDAGIFYRDT